LDGLAPKDRHLLYVLDGLCDTELPTLFICTEEDLRADIASSEFVNGMRILKIINICSGTGTCKM
jgi:hypothetical protein